MKNFMNILHIEMIKWEWLIQLGRTILNRFIVHTNNNE